MLPCMLMTVHVIINTNRVRFSLHVTNITCSLIRAWPHNKRLSGRLGLGRTRCECLLVETAVILSQPQRVQRQIAPPAFILLSPLAVPSSSPRLRSWLSSWSFAAPSRVTMAGLLPWLPLWRSKEFDCKKKKKLCGKEKSRGGKQDN